MEPHSKISVEEISEEEMKEIELMLGQVDGTKVSYSSNQTNLSENGRKKKKRKLNDENEYVAENSTSVTEEPNGDTTTSTELPRKSVQETSSSTEICIVDQPAFPSKEATIPILEQKIEVRRLPDILFPGIRVLFVGDNPGIKSAADGHWYAHATNHFWPLLFESGLIPEPLTSEKDMKVTKYGIGLTCLVGRSSRSSSELSKKELTNGLEELKEKLRKYRPQLVCFNGKGIYEEAVTGRLCKIGMQPVKLDAGEGYVVQCYVMPSSSARVKSHSRNDKLQCLKEIKVFLDSQGSV